MGSLRTTLAGGDRRSLGHSNRVVRQVLADPRKFGEVVNGLADDDLLVRMRCADVAEKVSSVHPDWLQPHKKVLLDLAGRATQQELRWHLAQMLPRLRLSGKERRTAIAAMLTYLSDDSRIVKTFALQALADFAVDDRSLRRRLLPLLETAQRNGSASSRARARLLLVRLRMLK